MALLILTTVVVLAVLLRLIVTVRRDPVRRIPQSHRVDLSAPRDRLDEEAGWRLR